MGGRLWKSTPSGVAAPKVDWQYTEREAARWWGYPSLGAWLAEEDDAKAQVVAHYWEHLAREGWTAEQNRPGKDGRVGGRFTPEWGKWRGMS